MAAPESPKEPPKTAALPGIAKKGKPGTDDEGEEKPGETLVLKQKTLPTGLSRAIVITGVIASLAGLAAGLLGSRYDLVPAPNSANGFMYRIDRLAGGVQFCGPQGCSEIPNRPAATP